MVYSLRYRPNSLRAAAPGSKEGNHKLIKGSTLPHPKPLTPLLKITRSPKDPTCILFMLTSPSSHRPLSSAQRLVAPKFPPALAAGVIQAPLWLKYGVVMLPSMMSAFLLTKRISAGKSSSSDRGRTDRASLYAERSVVLCRV